MNAVDATGALVPRERKHGGDRSAVVAPDPARAPTAPTSKFWGVHWDKKAAVAGELRRRERQAAPHRTSPPRRRPRTPSTRRSARAGLEVSDARTRSSTGATRAQGAGRSAAASAVGRAPTRRRALARRDRDAVRQIHKH